MRDLLDKLRGGDIRSIARLITLVERREPQALEAVREIYPHCGRAHLIGITGPPGVGKSCLVAVLARVFRDQGKKVGVLAVDPSSPFSGGALLGDRARMIELGGERDIFIRSLASRGALGGLSMAVNDAADILDYAGKDVILIETVGVGQGEIEIARLAHTCVLALMPGYGDTLQAMKAGIMEIADVFVVNKSDKPGADTVVSELQTVMHFSDDPRATGGWTPPIVKTSALQGLGVDELANAAGDHQRFLAQGNFLEDKNQDRRMRQFLEILSQRVRDQFLEELQTDQGLRRWVDKIGRLELDPYSASEQVIGLLRKARQHGRGLKETD